MTETIGVGMLGTGFIGMIHSYALRNVEIVKQRPPVMPRLVSVADLGVEARSRCRERFRWEDDGDDWRKIVADQRIGLSINCRPTHPPLDPTTPAPLTAS